MQRQRQLEEVKEEEQLIKAWAGSMEEAAASLLGARLKVRSHSSVMAIARPPLRILDSNPPHQRRPPPPPTQAPRRRIWIWRNSSWTARATRPRGATAWPLRKT